MQNGRRQRPYISLRSVRDALESMLYSASNASSLSNPLLYLMLIEVRLLDPDLPDTQITREHELSRYLATRITEQYVRIRQLQGLDTQTAESLSAIQSRITEERGHSELLAWSWLYHHYVRVDLAIRPELFCELTGLNERTLRRYQQHGVKRLTAAIVEDEYAVRRDYRKRRLLKLIAPYTLHNLIGRDLLLSQAQAALRSSASICLQITGAPGIGKSALTGTLLKWELEQDFLDHIIWIDHPNSMQSIRNMLMDWLPSESSIQLQEYVQLYAIAVILDDLELPAQEREPFLALLSELAGAQVIMTTRTYMPVAGSATIVLHDLDQTEALTLIRSRLELQFPDFSEKDVMRVWRCCGGNPGAIMLMCANIRVLARECPGVQSLDDALAAAVNSLPDEVVAAWIACVLVSQRATLVEDLLRLWPNTIELTHLDMLIAHNLIQLTNGRYISVSTAARVFVANRFNHDLSTKVCILNLLVALDSELAALATSESAHLLESILLGGWLDFDPAMKMRWLLRLWQWGLYNNRRADWQKLLHEYAVPRDADTLPLTLGYAIGLRSIAQFEQANSALNAIIAFCGERGLFDIQNRAMYELAVLYRMIGRYENAAALLYVVRRYAVVHSDSNLFNAATSEEARIALDMRDLERSELLLDSSEATLMSEMLRAELLLLKRDYAQCLELLSRLLQRYEMRMDVVARIHTLSAQALRGVGELRRAGEAQIAAVTLIERGDYDDPYGLARAWSNLGALLSEMRDYPEAQILLQRAASLQARIKDPVGLAATRHNQALLRIRISRR